MKRFLLGILLVLFTFLSVAAADTPIISDVDQFSAIDLANPPVAPSECVESYRVVAQKTKEGERFFRIDQFKAPFRFDDEGKLNENKACTSFFESLVDWRTAQAILTTSQVRRDALGVDMTSVVKSFVAPYYPENLKVFTPKSTWQGGKWREWLTQAMVDAPGPGEDMSQVLLPENFRVYEDTRRFVYLWRRSLLFRKLDQARREEWRDEHGNLLADQLTALYYSSLIYRARSTKLLIHWQIERRDQLLFDLNLAGWICPMYRSAKWVGEGSLKVLGQLPVIIRSALALAK